MTNVGSIEFPFNHEKIGFVKLVDRMVTDHSLKIVNAARLSYDTQKSEFDNKDRNLVNFLYKNDHTSPFRHSFYTFHIKAPISVFRQWIKYQVGCAWRTYEIPAANAAEPTFSVDILDLFFDTDKGCSWNEISRRYTQPKEEFYIVDSLRSNPPHGNKQSSGNYENPISPHAINYLEDPIRLMREFTELSLKMYKKLIDNGVAREIARDILPQNIYSEAYWTVSLQAVTHFLQQRLAPEAQFEIRSYANCVHNLIKPDLDKAGIIL